MTGTTAGVAAGTLAGVAPSPGRGRGMLRAALPFLLVAPAIILLSVFYLYPIAYNVVLSLFSWDLRGPMRFIGLGNFTELFTDESFFQILGNTLAYMVMEVVLVMALGLALAVFLRRLTFLNGVLQTLTFTPTIVALISVSVVFSWLMKTDGGLLNWLLSLVGSAPVGWLSDPQVALFSLVLVSVWKSTGLTALIILSAMQSVPPYLYEAAALDNAGPWSRFSRITLPMISPTLFFLVLINIIGSFQAFDTINVMTQGGPQNSTNTLIFSIYREGFTYYRVGYAAAMALVLMAIVAVISVVYFRLLQRKVHYR